MNRLKFVERPAAIRNFRALARDLVKIRKRGEKIFQRAVLRIFQAEIFFAESVARPTQQRETFFVAVNRRNFAQCVMNRLKFVERQAAIKNIRSLARDFVKIRERDEKIFQRAVL